MCHRPAVWAGTLLVLQACSIAPSEGPLVIPFGEGRPMSSLSSELDGSVDPQALASARLEIEELVSRGRLRAALEAIEAWLSRPLSERDAAWFRRRRLDIRRQVVIDEHHLTIEAEALPFAGSPGDEFRLRLRISNQGSERVHVPAWDGSLLESLFGGGASSVIYLEIDRRDWGPHGSEWGRSWATMIRLEEDITLDPGETWTCELALATPEPREFAVSRYLVRPRLHAVLFERSGVSEPLHTFPFPEVVFRCLPAGFEAIADDPMGSLRRALALPISYVDTHLVVAAELVSDSGREEAVRLLTEVLPDARGSRQLAIMTALRRLTGHSWPLDPGVWSRWWNRRAEGEPRVERAADTVEKDG